MDERWALRNVFISLRDDLPNVRPCCDGISERVIERIKREVHHCLDHHFTLSPRASDLSDIQQDLLRIANMLEAVIPSDAAGSRQTLEQVRELVTRHTHA
jgi:hypothetical protein